MQEGSVVARWPEMMRQANNRDGAAGCQGAAWLGRPQGGGQGQKIPGGRVALARFGGAAAER